MSYEEYIVVMITTKSKAEAEKIAHALVREKLAACVNIIDMCSSIYLWKGKVEKESEALMIVKSSRSLFGKLADRVTELHNYEVPEIIALSLEGISAAYLGYLKSTLAT